MSGDDDLPEVVYHPGVHEPHSFICGEGFGVVTLRGRQPAAIAASLLEGISDWMRALRTLPDTDLPPRVADLVGQLHEAVCGWTDFVAAAENSSRRAARDALAPDPPPRRPA